MKPPFRLPVRVYQRVYIQPEHINVMYDEPICRLIGATDKETEYIVWCINQQLFVKEEDRDIGKVTRIHDLYRNGDLDIPLPIKDINGDVMLAVCRICGKMEDDLSEPCISHPIVPVRNSIFEDDVQ